MAEARGDEIDEIMHNLDVIVEATALHVRRKLAPLGLSGRLRLRFSKRQDAFFAQQVRASLPAVHDRAAFTMMAAAADHISKLTNHIKTHHDGQGLRRRVVKVGFLPRVLRLLGSPWLICTNRDANAFHDLLQRVAAAHLALLPDAFIESRLGTRVTAAQTHKWMDFDRQLDIALDVLPSLAQAAVQAELHDMTIHDMIWLVTAPLTGLYELCVVPPYRSESLRRPKALVDSVAVKLQRLRVVVATLIEQALAGVGDSKAAKLENGKTVGPLAHLMQRVDVWCRNVTLDELGPVVESIRSQSQLLGDLVGPTKLGAGRALLRMCHRAWRWERPELEDKEDWQEVASRVEHAVFVTVEALLNQIWPCTLFSVEEVMSGGMHRLLEVDAAVTTLLQMVRVQSAERFGDPRAVCFGQARTQRVQRALGRLGFVKMAAQMLHAWAGDARNTMSGSEVPAWVVSSLWLLVHLATGEPLWGAQRRQQDGNLGRGPGMFLRIRSLSRQLRMERVVVHGRRRAFSCNWIAPREHADLLELCVLHLLPLLRHCKAPGKVSSADPLESDVVSLSVALLQLVALLTGHPPAVAKVFTRPGLLMELLHLPEVCYSGGGAEQLQPLQLTIAINLMEIDPIVRSEAIEGRVQAALVAADMSHQNLRSSRFGNTPLTRPLMLAATEDVLSCMEPDRQRDEGATVRGLKAQVADTPSGMVVGKQGNGLSYTTLCYLKPGKGNSGGRNEFGQMLDDLETAAERRRRRRRDSSGSSGSSSGETYGSSECGTERSEEEDKWELIEQCGVNTAWRAAAEDLSRLLRLPPPACLTASSGQHSDDARGQRAGAEDEGGKANGGGGGGRQSGAGARSSVVAVQRSDAAQGQRGGQAGASDKAGAAIGKHRNGADEGSSAVAVVAVVAPPPPPDSSLSPSQLSAQVVALAAAARVCCASARAVGVLLQRAPHLMHVLLEHVVALALGDSQHPARRALLEGCLKLVEVLVNRDPLQHLFAAQWLGCEAGSAATQPRVANASIRHDATATVRALLQQHRDRDVSPEAARDAAARKAAAHSAWRARTAAQLQRGAAAAQHGAAAELASSSSSSLGSSEVAPPEIGPAPLTWPLRQLPSLHADDDGPSPSWSDAYPEDWDPHRYADWEDLQVDRPLTPDFLQQLSELQELREMYESNLAQFERT